MASRSERDPRHRSSRVARARRWWACAAAVLALAAECGDAGCGDDAERSRQPRATPEPPSGIVRLVDRLADARIDVPPPPEASDEEARPVYRLDEGFPCPEQDGARRCRRDPTLGSAIVFAAVPVEPQQVYRWRREARAASSECATLQIAETAHPASEVWVGAPLHGPVLSRIHRLPAPSPGAWRSEAGSLLTGLDTRALVLALAPGSGCETAYRRLELDAVGMAAWYEERWPAPSTPRNLLREGYLLSAHDTGSTPDHTYRRALFLPAGASVSFDLRLPARPRLLLDLAPAPESRPGDVVTVRVRVTPPGGAPATVLERTVAPGPRGEGFRFVFEEVELTALAGREVALTISVTPRVGEGAALVGNPRIVSARAPGDPPNVVLIGVDTLRADYAPCAEDAPFRRLTSEGTCMTTAIAPGSWTPPSFASMFTARAPSEHRVTHWDDRLAPGTPTLAGRLAEAGWSTYAALYKNALRNVGLDAGFDAWVAPLWDPDVRAEDNLGLALSWLERHRRERFFFFWHLDDPHQPFNQPIDRRPTSTGAWIQEQGIGWPANVGGLSCEGCRRPDGGPSDALVEAAGALYGSEVDYVDWALGRFLDALDEYDLLDETWVVLVSDHGEILFDEEGFYGHGHDHYAEAATRVPWIVRPPGGGEPRVIEDPVSLLELAPTILDLVGVEAPAMAARVGLAGVFRGEDTPPPGPLVTEDGRGFDFAVRDGSETLVRGSGVSGLFDVSADPGQTHDLSAERPARVRALTDVALAQLMAHRPGRYVLVHAEDAVERVRVLTEAPVERWAPRGSSHDLASGERRVFRLPCGDDEVAVETVGEGGTESRRSVAFEAFDSARVLSDSPPAVIGVSTRCGSPAAASPAPSIDAQTLEQLRAQGYVE